MLHLRSITVRQWQKQGRLEFPFNLLLLQSLEQVEFTSPVTFFVGENGSGKSTLLEAIACAAGSVTVGSESVQTDLSLSDVRKFSGQLKLAWQKRTHRGFFLRAEDFFGYAKNVSQIKAELLNEIKTVDLEYHGRSKLAVDLAKMPYASELHDIRQKYGDGLEVRSHGESFLQLFQSRFVPNGLYLLDEPEAPLSPIRQLAFISALKEMVDKDAQFIIATHSPIIMAFPGAVILGFDGGKVKQVAYEDLEHVRLTRDFLNNPGAYLQHL